MKKSKLALLTCVLLAFFAMTACGIKGPLQLESAQENEHSAAEQSSQPVQKEEK